MTPRTNDVMGRSEFETAIYVGWKNGHPDSQRDAVLAHDEALRGLLAECRAVMTDAAENPVDVHARYRQEFARLVRYVDSALWRDQIDGNRCTCGETYYWRHSGRKAEVSCPVHTDEA